MRRAAGGVPEGVRDDLRELRPRSHERVRLRGRLDAAHGRLAVHPHRVHPAAAARQHRAPRRRDHGDARPREHPGLERHSDALRPAARLPADAPRARVREPAGLHRGRLGGEGLLGQHELLRHQPAEGVVGSRGDGGERLLLRLSAAHHRRARHLRHRDGAARGQVQGLLPDGPEPRGRARRTTECSGRRWQSSNGSSCATSR